MTGPRRFLFSVLRGGAHLGCQLGLHRFPALASLYSKTKAHLKSPEAWVEGFHLFLDPRDSLDLSLSSDYEAYERYLVSRLLKPGMTVVDIGANIGLYSLLFSRYAGPKGRVFAFEPCVENLRLLKRNIEENGCENVTIVPKAVSDISGQQVLYLSETNSGDHRTTPDGSIRKTSVIESVRLEDFFAGRIERPNLIKMDIQGAEYQALRGMESVLKVASQMVLLLEFWPWGLRQAGIEAGTLLQTLREWDFQIAEVDDRRGKVTLVEEDEPLLRAFPADRIEHTNLLCWKGKPPEIEFS